MQDIENILQHISQGVYVVGVADGDKTNAFTAAWVMQVSFSPVLLVISINPEHYSYQLLQKGGVCCVSVLDNEQYGIAQHFARSDIKDKMRDFSWKETKTKTGALAESLAYFDCRVDHFSDAGDHKLVVCKVIDAAILNEGDSMLYNDTADMDKSSVLY